MTTLFLTDELHAGHQMDGHPERPRRVQRIVESLTETGVIGDLEVPATAEATLDDLKLVHAPAYVDEICAFDPGEATYMIGNDTYLNSSSLRAARLAAGAARQATDAVLDGSVDNAFCAVRPPGHHAEVAVPMGFCFFNSVAIAAAAALSRPDVERVAILDIDAHHCNGTVDIFKDRPEVLVCSSFQDNFYPGRYLDYENDHVLNTPLAAGSTGADFRQGIDARWWQRIDTFNADLILLSAGFDAHLEDDISALRLGDEDYAWLIRELRAFAATATDGRLVSVLEGGYSEDVLGRVVPDHAAVLAGAA